MNTKTKFIKYVKQGKRAFGVPQSWSPEGRGIGGELLVADLLARQVDFHQGGSILFLGLDLGKKGAPYPHIATDERWPIMGFGGDIDAALFIRETQHLPKRYGASHRGLEQDHLVLIDSKQYSANWNRERAHDTAEQTIQWMRRTLSHPRLLGSGSDADSLRISYHIAHTGTWVPEAWLRKVRGGGPRSRSEGVPPNHKWWNSREDCVFEGPVEVLFGQLSILLNFSNHEYRDLVPEALSALLPPKDLKPFNFADMD